MPPSTRQPRPPRQPRRPRPGRRATPGAAANARNSIAAAAAEALPTAPPPRGARALPLSGSEPAYSPIAYGSPRGRGGNNCFAYSIDAYRNGGGEKLQPGELSRSPGELDLSTCDGLRQRTTRDLALRGGYPADADAPCRPGFYKIMAFLAPGSDYHFYVQNGDDLVRLPPGLARLSPRAVAAALAARLGVDPGSVRAAGAYALVKGAGTWSHKRGLATGPLLKDACGRAIRDPRAACRDYGGGLDYRTFCGAFCVPGRR